MDLFVYVLLAGVVCDWFRLRRRYAHDTRWVERMESWLGLTTDESERGKQ